MNTEKDKEYTAVVRGVKQEGRHGAYAVAWNEELGEVTFALTRDVWNEERLPEKGSIVVLQDITKKVAGWRANKARFYRPSDEKGESTNEKREAVQDVKL